jgi:hypothetical protein
VIGVLFVAASARGGLYYSGEQYASLPTQWRGFLLDHRALRMIAVKPNVESEASPMRVRYRQEADKLQARAKKEKLGPDELADLGALYVRLGELEQAIEVLRPAQEAHPNHFALAANLGTAWQRQGDLRQAAAALEDAVRLAPGKFLPFEEAHLKLVRLRQRGKPGELDDLFGIRYVGAKDAYEPGKVAAAQLKRLPSKGVAVVQQLALWLPSDGPLLWQLAELANAHGDVKNAAAMMEGCLVQFGLDDPALKKHRHILRDAVDTVPAVKVGEHTDQFPGTLQFRSRRPLLSKLETIALPPIDPKGTNPVPWELFGETGLDKPFKVSFPKYLRELEGKQISMTGFMYPLRDDPEMTAFLFIEAPVGCWYCEMPETTGIIYVEMPAGQTARYQRGPVRVVGRLSLNGADPEDFLYAVKNARVGALD